MGALFLAQHGVPYETALKMTPVRRKACIVAIKELQGMKFNWSRDEFEQPAS